MTTAASDGFPQEKMGNTKTIDSNSNSSSSEATASSQETILKQEQQVEKKSGI